VHDANRGQDGEHGEQGGDDCRTRASEAHSEGVDLGAVRQAHRQILPVDLCVRAVRGNPVGHARINF
jgi:hypothetical protein